MSRPKIALLLAALAATVSASAQISVNVTNTPTTLNFDGNVAGVMRFVPPITNTGVALVEADAWQAIGGDGQLAFITTGVTAHWYAHTAQATPFAADANKDRDTTDVSQSFDVNPLPSPAGGANNYSLKFIGNWSDEVLIFKVTNNTGSTVSNWSLALDTWFIDTAEGHATLRLGYATTYTAFSGETQMTGAGYKEVGARVSTNSNSGISTLETIGGLINATVAAGESLYLSIHYDVDSGGNAFLIDNLSITPGGGIPEPSTYAPLAD